MKLADFFLAVGIEGDESVMVVPLEDLLAMHRTTIARQTVEACIRIIEREGWVFHAVVKLRKALAAHGEGEKC